MRYIGRKLFFLFIILALAYIIIAGILSKVTSGRHLDKTFELESRAWVATSTNPIDKAFCYWVGLCGVFHFLSGRARPLPRTQERVAIADYTEPWSTGLNSSEVWSEEERHARDIPQYVLDYAPYVHLYSQEKYWPGNIAEHIAHTSQRLNFTELKGGKRGLEDLNMLNAEDRIGAGKNIYLQSVENVEEEPAWLLGRSNIPSPVTEPATSKRRARSLRHRELRRRRSVDDQQGNEIGRSSAPAVLIVVPKEDGVVDAFWFFFYSFNKAPKFFNIQFGNHIGDWEHTLIRFRNGIPESVSCSEHSFGSAYAYDALEKYLIDDDGDIFGTWSNGTLAHEAKRPVIYSASGSHAMYARPGIHPYILPFKILRDVTDRGPLWDPALNLHSYTYDGETLHASSRNPQSPTGWLDFNGRWGDKYYLLSDQRQYRFAGQYHYLNGPYGPKFKKLMRENVCQNPRKCIVLDEVDGR